MVDEQLHNGTVGIEMDLEVFVFSQLEWERAPIYMEPVATSRVVPQREPGSEIGLPAVQYQFERLAASSRPQKDFAATTLHTDGPDPLPDFIVAAGNLQDLFARA
jgi:hypothetical protein